MPDPRELGGLLFERDAELALTKQDEIEKAATWCRQNAPHKFQFLQDMFRLLIAEDAHMSRLGLAHAIRTGAVKRTPVLSILTPSQALRLLECYRRAFADDPDIWRARDIRQMDRIAAEKRCRATVEDIRRQLMERKNATDKGPATTPEEPQTDDG